MISSNHVFYLLIPLITTPIILFLLFNYRIHYPRLLPLLCINFGLVAFSIEPHVTDDLYRYFYDLEEMRNRGVYFVENISGHKDFFITNYYFYFISFLNNNHFLPAISTFIAYYIILYIMFDFANRNNIDSRKLIIISLLTVSIVPFYEIAGGIRNALCFTVFILALYKDTIQGKKNLITIILYFISISIHSASILLVTLRILLVFFNTKKKMLFLLIIILFWPLYINEILKILLLLPDYKIVEISIGKIIDYTIEAKGSLSWSRDILLYRLGITIFFVIFAFFIIDKTKKYNPSLYKYINFLLIVSFFVIGSTFEMYINIIFRYTSFIFMAFSLPLLFGKKYFPDKLKVLFLYLIFLFTCAGLYYQILVISNLNFSY